MPRAPKESDEALLTRALSVFRAWGYDGASLSRLSEATGLKRASLYHRFPGGKEEIARETLAALRRWVEAQVVGPLRKPGDPRARLAAAAQAFSALYDAGHESSLVNLFAAPAEAPPSLLEGVQEILSAMTAALSAVLEEAGFPEDEARRRAVRGLVLIEGAVVVSRSFRDPAPFREVTAHWVDDLLHGIRLAASTPSPAQPKKAAGNDPNADVRRAVARHLAQLSGKTA